MNLKYKKYVKRNEIILFPEQAKTLASLINKDNAFLDLKDRAVHRFCKFYRMQTEDLIITRHKDKTIGFKILTEGPRLPTYYHAITNILGADGIVLKIKYIKEPAVSKKLDECSTVYIVK